MISVTNLKIELRRLRRLLEHPRKQYWRRFTDAVAEKKYAKLDRKARDLSARIYQLSGEEL